MSSSGITPITKSVTPIPASATVVEAARLIEAEQSTLPVVDDTGRVLGVVDSGTLLKALVPRYLEELSHTGFIRQDPAGLLRHALKAAQQPVCDVVQTLPEYLQEGASEAHAAELFLHTGVLAIPVVDADGGLVGVVRRVDLVVALATD
ncbi:MAG: CBS domain-containing protein [Thermoleophilia bacterium]